MKKNHFKFIPNAGFDYLLNWWRFISNLGVSEKDPIVLQRAAILLNRLILISLLLRTLSLFYSLLGIHFPPTLKSLLINLTLPCLLYLNYRGYVIWVKFLLLISFIYPPYLIAINYSGLPPYLYLMYQVALQLVALMFMIMIFDWQHEKKEFVIAISILFINFMCFDSIILQYIDIKDTGYEENIGHMKFWTTLLWLAVLWASLINKRIIYAYEKRLTLLNEELLDKSEKITQVNKELAQSNEELAAESEIIASLNQNLEFLVEEKTKDLMLKNQKLEDYAFFNAHKVRGPLARILGICIMLESVPELNLEEKLEFIDKIFYTAKELDNVIKEINTILKT